MLEHGDGIPKTPLIWVHTLMSLVLLFHFAAPRTLNQVDSHRSRILHKLQQFGVHPDTLHYSSCEEPNTAYCIFQVDFEFSRLRTGYRQPSSLLYVGSTAVGASKRHLNRMAVYRRLKKTEFVDAELSLRYWASHDNLFRFALVPLQSYENYQLAWVTEHELIAQWQIPLNYPRAMALIKKAALGFRISSKRGASLYGTFGLRLWRKWHKRMHRRNQRFFVKNSRELAWGLLFKLGSRTRAAFETSKLLRSRQTADEEVYPHQAQSQHMESPSQPSSRVAQECGQVSHQDALAQNIQAPGCLSLCHPHFTSQCERWLRNIILQYKCLLPSFHVPKNSLREVPHQSIKKFLHNFQSWEEAMWDPAFKLDSVPRPCAKYRNKLPDRCFSSGHVAAGLEEFEAMVPGCGSITSAPRPRSLDDQVQSSV